MLRNIINIDQKQDRPQYTSLRNARDDWKDIRCTVIDSYPERPNLREQFLVRRY